MTRCTDESQECYTALQVTLATLVQAHDPGAAVVTQGCWVIYRGRQESARRVSGQHPLLPRPQGAVLRMWAGCPGWTGPLWVVGLPHVQSRSWDKMSSHGHTAPVPLVGFVPIDFTGWWRLQIRTQTRVWLWELTRRCH